MEFANLGEMLRRTCESFSERTAIIAGDRRISYGDIRRNVAAMGNALGRLGVTKGDKVAIMLPNVPEFVISYWAAVSIGAVAVTINAQSTAYELEYLLDNSDSKVLILEPGTAKSYEGVRADLFESIVPIFTSARNGAESIEAILAQDPCELDIPAITGSDAAVIIYTAGLTGRPMGAVLTHHNLLTQSELLRDMCGGTREDRGLCIIPLFHAFGAVANMIALFRLGGSTVMMDNFNIEAMFKTIERERVTYIAAVPRVFLGMFIYRDGGKYDVSSLRFCITGGSKMPVEFIENFAKQFSVKLMEGYGLTEASPVCSFSRPHMEQKPGSIGIPIPGVEAKVLDEEGRKLPSGEVGELVLRGPNVMKGYYKDDGATSEVIRNGWLYTGDLAYMDDDNYIFLQGLKKRMIITSGFNVYPREVENVLEMHPGVAKARVVGKENLLRGELVKALVVKEEGADVDGRDIIRFCRIYLSPYKSPREVEFVEDIEE